MIFKTYQIYLGKVFTSTLLKTFIVFVSLAFILNIFEEINFFKDLKVSITLPIFLTFLNIPSIIFDIFPFIFLITAQFAFIKLMDQNEIIVLKNFGLDNLKIIKILSVLSFFIGLIIITIYYNFSSSLKSCSSILLLIDLDFKLEISFPESLDFSQDPFLLKTFITESSI